MFDLLLQQCIEQQGSDLHISVNQPIYLRQHGQLKPLGECLSLPQIEAMIQQIVPDNLLQSYQQDKSIDFAYSLNSGQRFRINIYYERQQPALAVRYLDSRFRSLQSLGLPEQLYQLCGLKDGLVLVTGATGSGKTTTLAQLIHKINQDRACHILTIEDPIEYLHQNIQSLVHQRELHLDVPSYPQAIRSALREDPDVILVGEMRDLETMRVAITAAETGHLVFSTLHTGDAVGVIERILGSFPAEEQAMVRQQLSRVLRAVVAQRLLPIKQGEGRVPALEILMINPAVANLIRHHKTQQVYSVMESATTDSGMQTLEQSLADLVKQQVIDKALAIKTAHYPDILQSQLRQRGLYGR